jgi:hypothetical protein
MRSPSGALLNRFDATRISTDPDTWSRVYRQLLAETMPPAGARRPDHATRAATLAAIEEALGARAAPSAAVDSAVATRLAAMLWNGAPDEELLREAQSNRLGDMATLERQVRRMLADERAQAFVSRFFWPWLQLDGLADADPDTKFRGLRRRVARCARERDGAVSTEPAA